MRAPASAVLLTAILGLSSAPAQTVVQGEPFGYAKISIAAGTGTAKRTTLLSIPLLEEANITGRASGRITGVTSNTVTVAGAGWQPGQLSTAATPHLLEITSGQAKGRMLMLAAGTTNTTDTVTVALDEVQRVGPLNALGILTGAQNGDTYRIRPVDTLRSFFGTPETTLIRGGTAPANADTVIVVLNGSPRTYYYHTDLGRWTEIGLQRNDGSHVPIPPYAGVQYSRLANTPLQFIVTGKVPAEERKVAIKTSGTTLLAPFWPVSQTLGSLALQNTTNWVTGANSSMADTVTLSAAGSVNTFFHDGTNWRRVGLNTSPANTNPVPIGAAVLINKRGSAGGFSTYRHLAPYSLE